MKQIEEIKVCFLNSGFELILQMLSSCQHFPLYGLGLGVEVLSVFRNVLTFSKSTSIFCLFVLLCSLTTVWLVET